MTLGEFRKCTMHMPDNTPLQLSYGDRIRNVNSFEVNGLSLVLCEGVYDQLDGIGIARAMLKLNKKSNDTKRI